MSEKIATLNEQEAQSVKYMESMMESCYCYGGVEKDSYNFERYIAKYQDELPEFLFWVTYYNKKQSLEDNYEVLRMTSQDGEGNWYNTLKRKL